MADPYFRIARSGRLAGASAFVKKRTTDPTAALATREFFTSRPATTGVAFSMTNVSWSGLWRDYAGDPWPSVQTVNPRSGPTNVLSHAGGAVGTPSNGHAPAVFDGTTNDFFGVDTNKLVTDRYGTVHFVFEASALSPRVGAGTQTAYQDAALFTDSSGNFGVALTDQGAVAYAYDVTAGAYAETVAQAWAVGGYNLGRLRWWTNPNGTLTLGLTLNNASENTVTIQAGGMGWLYGLSGTFMVGENYAGARVAGSLLELAVGGFTLSDAEYAKLGPATQTTFSKNFGFAAAASAIAGSSSFVTAASATLRGAGRLVGSSGPATFSSTAALGGSARAVGSAAAVASSTAAIAGRASLVGGSSATFAGGTAALRGAATLAASSAASFASGTAALAGTGAMAGAAAATFAGTASVDAGGMVAASSATFAGTAVLSGAGALAGASAASVAASAVGRATGTLAASAAASCASTASLVGAGALSGASTVATIATASPSAASSGLAATAALATAATGALAGTANAAGSAAATTTPTASIAASGRLVGASAVTFTPTATARGAATTSASAATSFATVSTLRGTAGASAPATFAAAAAAVLVATAALSGTASAATTAGGAISARAELVAAASVAFDVFGDGSALATTAGATAVTFAAIGTLAPQAASVPAVLRVRDAPRTRMRPSHVTLLDATVHDARLIRVTRRHSALALLTTDDRPLTRLKTAMSNYPYNVGDVAVLTVELRVAEALTDPTSITLKVKAPTAENPVDVTPTKSSTGKYKAEIACTEAGTWRYRWVTTGSAAGAEPGFFTVKPNEF